MAMYKLYGGDALGNDLYTNQYLENVETQEMITLDEMEARFKALAEYQAKYFNLRSKHEKLLEALSDDK